MLEEWEVAASLVTMRSTKFRVLWTCRALVFLFMLGYLASRAFYYQYLEFFTVWGYYAVMIAQITGAMATWKLRHVLREDKLREGAEAEHIVGRRNHSVWCAWKWHVVFQEMSFHFQMQIGLIFWGMLWSTKKPEAKCFICEVPSHLLPILSVMFEFWMTEWPF